MHSMLHWLPGLSKLKLPNVQNCGYLLKPLLVDGIYQKIDTHLIVVRLMCK